jgi:hypothetical protein
MSPGQHKFKGAGVIAPLPQRSAERLNLSEKLHFEVLEATPPISKRSLEPNCDTSPVRRSLTAMCGGFAAVRNRPYSLACFDSVQQLTCAQSQ